jgi:hypothetical protein
VLQHLLCHLKISDYAVFHGTDGSNIARGSTQHAFGIGSDGCYGLLTVMVADGNDRWLIQYDTFPSYVDQCVSCPQVYRQIVGKHTSYFFEHRIPAYLNNIFNGPAPGPSAHHKQQTNNSSDSSPTLARLTKLAGQATIGNLEGNCCLRAIKIPYNRRFSSNLIRTLATLLAQGKYQNNPAQRPNSAIF